MKAITLTQPWATLVAIGAKKFETRGWATDYRGPIAIHAARGFPGWAKDACRTWPFQSTLAAEEYHSADDLPRGVIVAVGVLHAIYKIGQYSMWSTGAEIALPDGLEFQFGEYSPGRYAWQLDEIQRLRVPVPAMGALGIWDVPANLIPEIYGLTTAKTESES